MNFRLSVSLSALLLIVGGLFLGNKTDVVDGDHVYPTVPETLDAILAAIGRSPQITSQLGQSLCGLNEHLRVRSPLDSCQKLIAA